ncbi:MAG: hypothetical protein AMS14_10905 [Planctomycetes bacterium DG_20]|nr:MAG: hypothetical protein AMS14_10905 [Planctomycetes bacterium DG_20]
MAKRRRQPEIVFRDGRPAAVILDIDDYEEMLQRLEDLEDLEALREIRRGRLTFRSLDEFLEEHVPGV